MFVVLISQDGGCDYTIGCGKNWLFLDAENKEDAIDELKTIIFGVDRGLDEDEDPADEDIGLYIGEMELANATLLEVSNETEIPLETWYEEAENLEIERKAERQRLREQVEYKRLKAKYG